MGDPQQEKPPVDDRNLREEEEAADRARGRTTGPGEAPRDDEVDAPASKDAPTAPPPGEG
ncbi:MAG: hypothetical protein ACM3S1_04590 [Hyphomicrobiales bacterium]